MDDELKTVIPVIIILILIVQLVHLNLEIDGLKKTLRDSRTSRSNAASSSGASMGGTLERQLNTFKKLGPT